MIICLTSLSFNLYFYKIGMMIIPTSKGYCENQVEQDLARYKISTQTLAFINKVAATSPGLTICPALTSVYYMVYFTWLPIPTLHPSPSPNSTLSMWASVMQRKAQVPSQALWPARDTSQGASLGLSSPRGVLAQLGLGVS